MWKRTLGIAVLIWLVICSGAYIWWGRLPLPTTLLEDVLTFVLGPGLLAHGLMTGAHRDFEDWRDPALIVSAASTFWVLVTAFGRHLWSRYTRNAGHDAA